MAKELKLKRGGIKSSLTNFKKFVDKYDAEKTSLTNLQTRLECALPLLENFEATQLKLEALQDGTEHIDEQIRNEFSELYYDTIAKAKDILASAMINSSQDQRQQSTSMDLTHSFRTKLPTLTLLKFDGDYTKWLAFKDNFVSTIHEDNSLTTIEKFRYLRSSLQGDAFKLVSALETKNENYEAAWQMLLNRYENTRIIVHTHMKALFNVPNSNRENTLRQTIDQFQIHLSALKALKEPVQEWDTILIHLLSTKIDARLKSEWEVEIINKHTTDKPKLEDFIQFLQNRCQIYEIADKVNRPDFQKSNTYKKNIACAAVTQACNLCSESHHIYKCDKFLELSAANRASKIRELRLCMNCFKSGHYVRDCNSTSTCKKCSKKHNTLLHTSQETKTSRNEQSDIKETTNKSQEEQIVTTHATQRQSYEILLSTAIIHVYGKDNKMFEARALLDSGSQSSFISKGLMKKLGLKGEKRNIPVHGVGNALTNISEAVKIEIKSRHNNFKSTINCLVLSRVTNSMPSVRIDKSTLSFPDTITLADPDFNIPKEVDILLGADIFWELLCIGQIRLGRDKPVIQKTLLGWVISGPIGYMSKPIKSISSHHTMKANIESQLEKFWKTEEIINKVHLSKEELQCETHFQETFTRNREGRFIVALPRKQLQNLGDSIQGAERRFCYLERKLDNNTELKTKYCEFMKQYESLGHMTEILEYKTEELGTYFFFPHHPILKEDSLTTKLRVVFDGSFKTTTGVSLNDELLVGPTIQDELFNIILRFRSHECVITADIAMMFRQILVRPEDRCFQRICWRENKNEKLKYYNLNTVTYGTASAPFLAARVLKQLAIEDGMQYPLAKIALENDFYMDDVLTGTKDIETAIELQNQLTELLKGGGFSLRKWRTNTEDILAHLDNEAKTQDMLKIDHKESIKTLGILWNAQTDTIEYSIQTGSQKRITKRQILSQISTIFDPLGLVGPVIITAKIMLQELWKLQSDWDEVIPQYIHTQWCSYAKSLPILNNLKIDRNINPNNASEQFDLHGFCDASEKAYGACVYAVSKNKSNEINTWLICAKSKVAPLKSVTLPRLELCGALVLARLTDTLKKALVGKIRNIYLWSDSTIVLSWLKTQPNLLKTFVSNRVSEIQERTANATWNHVNSEDNPADVISRGVPADILVNCELWWKGPKWLQQNNWPTAAENEINETSLEHKICLSHMVVREELSILTKLSSIERLQRVIAYVLRFINYKKQKVEGISKNLTVNELNQALLKIIFMIQGQAFAQEVKALRNKEDLPKTSKLLNLNPFMDATGLIRVGGRLKNADITADHKHPYVLPATHHVTTLIVQREHQKLHHSGTEHVLASLRMKYWILSGRRVVKKTLRNCIKCFRYRPKVEEALMGDLPKPRISEVSRPFLTSGVDYAGPILVKEGKRRGRPVITKAYVAIFVCFSTKAAHIELVSDLTSEAFLAALKRFTSRRGLCSDLYSDNATNFVGANAKLKEVYQFIKNNEDDIRNKCAQNQITWHFIPPKSPNFGGLWESAVKSMKTHFTKVTTNLILTFEECYTLLTEIEAIMNSRPLSSLSADPNDLNPLTPSHFLIGDSLLAPLENCLTETPSNRLSRWEHLQKVKQHLWQRWHREYLHQLQTRSKWRNKNRNLQPGDVVLLVDNNTPPLQWNTGRIIDVHPGADNIVRVVTVKCKSGLYKRPVNKCCVLPLITEDEL